VTVLDKFRDGHWRGQPESVYEDIRAIVNDRLIEEPDREARIEAVLGGWPLADQLAALRQRARTGTNGDFAGDDQVDLSDWEPIDLRPVLDGTSQPILPALLYREDGAALFYPAKVNGLHADSGVGKSWVATIVAAQQIGEGRHVAWIDLEGDEQVIIERLRALCVADDAIADRFHYLRPVTPFGLESTARTGQLIADTGATVVVIDSVGEAFALAGIDENRDVDVGPWYRKVARRLADTGAAVILIDHATKAADNPLHPSGSKRKRAAITGASYLVEATKPLTKEHGGVLRLVCAKDRHGTYGRGDTVARLEMNAYPDSSLIARVYPPLAADKTTDTTLVLAARAAVRAVKEAGSPLSTNGVCEAMRIKARVATKRAGLELAVTRGHLRTVTGPRRSSLHEYVSDWIDPTEAAS
jgi:hypothetical protein